MKTNTTADISLHEEWLRRRTNKIQFITREIARINHTDWIWCTMVLRHPYFIIVAISEQEPAPNYRTLVTYSLYDHTDHILSEVTTIAEVIKLANALIANVDASGK